MKGHVRKRGKKWCFVLDVGIDPETGKRKQKWFSGFNTKKEAEKAMVEKISEINRGDFIEPSKLTVGELLNLWLKDNVSTTTTQTTYDGYKFLSETHIIPRIGKVPLEKLTPIILQGLYTELLREGKLNGKGGLSGTSVHHIHRICHTALQWALKMGLVNKNIADIVTPPKKDKKEMLVWTANEVEQFLAACKGETLYPLYYLAIYTGMRRGELLALKWSDIDFERATISIRRTVNHAIGGGLRIQETTKTSTGRRSVSISSSVIQVLKAHRKRVHEQLLKIGIRDIEFVFVNDLGNIFNPSYISRRFHKIIKRAGVPRIRFHDLRHTHATLLLQQGVHPKIVSERLGHSKISVTLDTYSHVIPSMQKEAAQAFDNLFDKKSKKHFS